LVTKNFPFFFIAGSSLHVIASLFLPVVASFFFSRHCEFLPSRHCESLSSRHCEERSDEAIFPLLHPVIANRRVGKCAGVKQSPRCSFLLVLSVLGRLLRSLRSLAMTRKKCSLAMTPLSVIARSEATKQSTRYAIPLELSILRRLLRSLRSLAMTKWDCSLAMTQWGCSLAMAHKNIVNCLAKVLNCFYFTVIVNSKAILKCRKNIIFIILQNFTINNISKNFC